MHIVIASIEKIVPTLNDASTILRVLARSATGQEMSVYTTFSTGPRRPGDLDGPEEFHVVLLDNGRTALLGTEFADMLRCIRCGACLDHCPVYQKVGGHAYGWVYSGPMGAVLTPGLLGIEKATPLPNASTFCGRCESVCPMRIPLPKMLRHWREREFERHLTPSRYRTGMALWGFLARHPRLYRLGSGLAARFLGCARTPARRLPLPAPGGGLDGLSRHAGTGGAQLPPALGPAPAMSRDQILGNIRRALHRAAAPDTAPLETRLSEPPTGPIPARGQLPRPERIELFLAMAKRASASVARVADAAAVPAAVADFLARENLPARLKLAPDPALTGLPWESRPLIEISTGASAGDDPVSLGHAVAGIAETGTLMLASGPMGPSTLNFLPETEIVLLSAEGVVGGLEEAWRLLREPAAGGAIAAHGQFHHRPLAQRRYRPEAAAGRAWAPAAAYHPCRRIADLPVPRRIADLPSGE